MNAVAAYKNLNANKAKLKKLNSQLEKIVAEIQSTEKLVELGARVEVIHDGVAIGGFDNHLYGLDGDAEERSANFYLNAHNRKTWGVEIVTGRLYTLNVDRTWLGAGYPSRAVVRKIALDFIAHGVIPPESKRKYR